MKTSATLSRRLDTQECRDFWAAVDEAARVVAGWPAWKRGDFTGLAPSGDPVRQYQQQEARDA